MILLPKYLAEVNWYTFYVHDNEVSWYTFYVSDNDLGLDYEHICVDIIQILCTCEHTHDS